MARSRRYFALDDQLGQPVADEWVLEQRHAVALVLLGERHQAVDVAAGGGDAVDAGPLIAEGGAGDSPPVVLLAHHVLFGNDDVIEEYLAVGAHDVGQEADGHAWGLQVHQEEGDAFVLGNVRDRS